MVQKFLTFRSKIKDKFFWLLLALASLIFLPSFVNSSTSKDLLIYICLGSVLVMGVVVAAETTRKFYHIGLLALVALVFNSLSFSVMQELLFLLRMISLMLFFGWLLSYVFKKMAKARRISENVIYGAVDGYLLLGILGGFACRIIHHFYPDAFFIPSTLEGKLDVFTYFSFVTLTNLGYGDITPVTSPSQSIALFLAISGQLYLAIVIGILVGKFLLIRNNRK